MNEVDIFKIEEKHRVNIRLAKFDSTNNHLLFNFVSFYEDLFEQENLLIIEAYLADSIYRIITLLHNYSPFGIAPEKSARLINLIPKIIQYASTQEDKKKLENNLDKI